VSRPPGEARVDSKHDLPGPDAHTWNDDDQRPAHRPFRTLGCPERHQRKEKAQCEESRRGTPERETRPTTGPWGLPMTTDRLKSAALAVCITRGRADHLSARQRGLRARRCVASPNYAEVCPR
jgi:hypothetical protein